jgi:hypothetical protein
MPCRLANTNIKRKKEKNKESWEIKESKHYCVVKCMFLRRVILTF